MQDSSLFGDSEVQPDKEKTQCFSPMLISLPPEMTRWPSPMYVDAPAAYRSGAHSEPNDTGNLCHRPQYVPVLGLDMNSLEAYKLARAYEVPKPGPGTVDYPGSNEIPTRHTEVVAKPELVAKPEVVAEPEAVAKPAWPPVSCGIWSDLNTGTGCLEIQWIATARKLTSNDRVFTSPDFKILGMRFKMFVCARPTDGGLTGSFRHASGFGHVFLKYEAQSPHEDLSLEFRLSVGTRSQEVRHNFGRMATWGPSGAPAWDLSAAVDRQSMTLRILLEVWG